MIKRTETRRRRLIDGGRKKGGSCLSQFKGKIELKKSADHILRSGVRWGVGGCQIHVPKKQGGLCLAALVEQRKA